MEIHTLLQLFLAIVCWTSSTSGQERDPPMTFLPPASENDEIAFNLKNAIDNFDAQERTSGIDLAGIFQEMNDGSASENSNAFDAPFNIGGLPGVQGDSNNLDTSLADILAQRSQNQNIPAEQNEVQSEDGKTVKGRLQRRRFRNRRTKPEASEDVNEESQRGRRLGLDRNRRRRQKPVVERPRRLQKARQGIRKRYENTANNIYETANKALQTASDVAQEVGSGVQTVIRNIDYAELNERLTEMGAGIQNVAQEVGTNVQSAINNIDFELINGKLNETATKTFQYILQLAERELPFEIVEELLTTRMGGATETVKAILEARDPKAVMEDLGKNYVNVWKKLKGEMDVVLSTLISRSPSPDLLPDIPGMDKQVDENQQTDPMPDFPQADDQTDEDQQTDPPPADDSETNSQNDVTA